MWYDVVRAIPFPSGVKYRERLCPSGKKISSVGHRPIAMVHSGAYTNLGFNVDHVDGLMAKHSV